MSQRLFHRVKKKKKRDSNKRVVYERRGAKRHITNVATEDRVGNRGRHRSILNASTIGTETNEARLLRQKLNSSSSSMRNDREKIRMAKFHLRFYRFFENEDKIYVFGY